MKWSRIVLAQQLGGLIKQKRAQKALKQVDLARAAKVSRTVLSRLEHGNASAVQTDVLDRILAVLDVRPRMAEGSASDDARRHARLEQQKKLERQRSRHLRLAIELASDDQAAAASISRARDAVDLWRRRRTCSPYYIERWSELLDLPPRKLARAMASLGPWEDALFQNTPWSWVWT